MKILIFCTLFQQFFYIKSILGYFNGALIDFLDFLQRSSFNELFIFVWSFTMLSYSFQFLLRHKKINFHLLSKNWFKLKNLIWKSYNTYYLPLFLGYTFPIILCSHYFRDIQKKGRRPKWTIYKHVSDKNKTCLSADNFGILSVVVIYSLSTAYTSLCKGLKYLLKVKYFILVYLNIALCLKIKVYLHQTFTECVYNKYAHFDISLCQMQLQVIEGSLILLCFWFFHKLLTSIHV